MHDSPTEMYINVLSLLTLRNIGAWIFSRAMQCKHEFFFCVCVCLIHL